MPVAQGINGTIVESQQTTDQREAFQVRYDSIGFQKQNISTIFSSSPIWNGDLQTNDRSDLYKDTEVNDDEGKKDLLIKSYANFLTSEVSNGFGFNNSKVQLSMRKRYEIKNTGIAVPEGYSVEDGVVQINTILQDQPQLGSANLNVVGDLNNPSAANANQSNAERNINFGTNVEVRLGQYFSERFRQ